MHAVVTHDDAVVDANRIELEGDAAGVANRVLDDASELLQVHMARNDVDVRVADGDEGLVEIARRPDLAGGAQEAAVWRALEAALDGVRAHAHATCIRKRRSLM